MGGWYLLVYSYSFNQLKIKVLLTYLHFFTSKLIIERTITARNEFTHLIMLNMSKAFDSIKGNQLIKDLGNTIETDELHIISTLLNVSLSVRCKSTLSKVFQTDSGAPPGDCAIAL